MNKQTKFLISIAICYCLVIKPDAIGAQTLDEELKKLIPPETLFQQFLRYGLLIGAVFQFVCIFAIILFPSESNAEPPPHSNGHVVQPAVGSNKKSSGSAVKQKQKQDKTRKRR